MNPAPIDNERATWMLAVFLGVVAAQRIGELLLSKRNAARVRARGARESGAAHFPFIVAVHVLFLASLAAEVWFCGARPGGAWPLWLLLWLGAQALRYAAIRFLGDRWNTRILVVPGEAPVRSGPYRFLRHPNYVAVAVELVAASMLFGAWRTTLVISLLNAAALRIRIREENKALRVVAIALLSTLILFATNAPRAQGVDAWLVMLASQAETSR